ncbi:MAG: matrixin family metalloprotease [Acidimicrobiales bacterium]
MGVRAGFGPPAPAAHAAPAVPGETARRELTLENTGDTVEEVRMSLEGEAAAWGWVTPAAIALGPGERAVASVNLKLPRAPHPPAGPLPIGVAVSFSGGRAVASTTLDVAPFVDLFATLEPATSTGRRAGHHVLRVENRGNARVTASVEGQSEEVSVDVAPDRVEVVPGQPAQVQVTASAGRRATGTRTFAVLVRPDGPGRPARAEGAVRLAGAGWTTRVALLLLVLAVAAVSLGSLFAGSDDTATEATEGPEATGAASPPADPECPGRDHLSPDANGIVRPDVKPAFDYTFLFVEDGCRPARFNPCAPVRYTLNRRLASDADVATLEEALRKTAAATGLQFEYAGPSDLDPLTVPRPVRGADGSLTWPPVNIGWAHLGRGERLRSRDAIREAPDTVIGGGGRPVVVGNVITTGNLVLNLDAVADTDTDRPVPHGFGPGVNWGRIMLHELGHVIGLGHVESRTSIMNESLTQQTISSSEWGVGDLIGLRHLGRAGGCVDVPPIQASGAPR